MTAPSPPPPRPIENSYPLPTGLGFAGQYPGDLNEDVTRQKIRALLSVGVTVFIDLTEPNEDARGTPLRAYEQLLSGRQKRPASTSNTLGSPYPTSTFRTRSRE